MNYTDHVIKGNTRYELYPKALADGIATEYSSSSTYAVNDYCIHEGEIYQCKIAITTAEAWTAAHWEKAVLAENIADLGLSIVNGALCITYEEE